MLESLTPPAWLRLHVRRSGIYRSQEKPASSCNESGLRSTLEKLREHLSLQPDGSLKLLKAAGLLVLESHVVELQCGGILADGPSLPTWGETMEVG